MRPPSPAEIESFAADLDLSLDEGELEDFAAILASTLERLEALERVPEPRLAPSEIEYTDRPPGHRPSAAEDPHNAWITKCRVEGADDGPLAGMTVGLKDTVSLAGTPTTLGAGAMAGHVPTVDATVVTRLLEAGATIVGKNNMIGLGTEFGPAENPTAPEYSVGGSSSGGAAAVAAGEADVALGGDQGGSVRVPASFAGLVGLKPTHGLIPYTGIFGYDRSYDHTGPITRTVEDAALVTRAVAGRDGLDARQPTDLRVPEYTEELGAGVEDVSVGVLLEGFELEQSDEDVNGVVHDAVAELEGLGATVSEVSVPDHALAAPVVHTLLHYGMGQTMRQYGGPTGFDGWYDTGLARQLGQTLDSRADDLSPLTKVRLLLTAHLQRNYAGVPYGKARNLSLALRRAYDEALERVDALALPTVPSKPPEAGELLGMEQLIEEGAIIPSIVNTGLFNMTHHPAISVPCGRTEGAPVGLMLIGERFDEATLFRIADAFERATEHGAA